MDREFLKDLLATPSVSGYEEAIQAKALAYGKEFAHTQLTDPSGNAISVVNPNAGFRVLLCRHIDEIGFVATSMTKDCFTWPPPAESGPGCTWGRRCRFGTETAWSAE